MAKKLFVGGLPFDFSNEKLQELFATVGNVLSAIMVQDPVQGRTRGFGFVAMSTPAESLAAIEKLNGTKIGDKAIYVTEAREKTPRASLRPENATWDHWKQKKDTRNTPGLDGRSTGNSLRGVGQSRFKRAFNRPEEHRPGFPGKRPFKRDSNDRRPGFPSPGFRSSSLPAEGRGSSEAPRRPFGRGPYPYNYQDPGTRQSTPPTRKRSPFPYDYKGEGTSSASSRNRKRGEYPYSEKPPHSSGLRSSPNRPSKNAFWHKFKKDKPQG